MFLWWHLTLARETNRLDPESYKRLLDYATFHHFRYSMIAPCFFVIRYYYYVFNYDIWRTVGGRHILRMIMWCPIDEASAGKIGSPARLTFFLWGGARWPSGLERSTGDRTVEGSNPTAENVSLRNLGNSVYPALPVSFGGDTKSCRSLLSGVYARGSKRPHQSALECVTVVDSTAHSKLPQKCIYAAENAALKKKVAWP